MKKLLPLVAFAACLASCSTIKEEKGEKPTIVYAMKNFRVESAKGCKGDSIPCAYYEINYPEFSGLDSSVVKKVKTEIENTLTMGNPEAKGKSMQQLGAEFVQSFDEFTTEMPEPMGWFYTADVKVQLETDTLLSLATSEDYFTGGAHGGNGMYFININPVTGKKFTLNNFFKEGYIKSVTEVGEKIFREVREMAADEKFSENYFEFPNDQFKLNDNYGFTKEGIAFHYNSYEIAPYAAGPTSILIPYEQVKEWIK